MYRHYKLYKSLSVEYQYDESVAMNLLNVIDMITDKRELFTWIYTLVFILCQVYQHICT